MATIHTEKVKENKELFRSQQKLGKVSVDGTKSHIIVERDSKTIPSRNDQGILILFEDKNAPGLNVDRQDQFITVDIRKEIFDIEEVKKVIDININELKREKTLNDKLQEFFRLYEDLLPNVPISGETGSVQFLIRRGSEQQSGELFDPLEFEEITSGSFGDFIQRCLSLQNSVDFLANTSASLVNLMNSLKLQLEAMGELVLLANVSGSEGVSLSELLDMVAGIFRKSGGDSGNDVNNIDSSPLVQSTDIIPILVDSVRTDVVRLNRFGAPRVVIDYTITGTVFGVTNIIEEGSKRTPFEIKMPISDFRKGSKFSTTLSLKDREAYAFSGWFRNNEEFNKSFTVILSDERPNTVVTMSVGLDMFDGEENLNPSW